MAIGPMDIHHKEFSTVRMGGYNKEDVDSFLDLVADELDRLLHRGQEQAELLESTRQKAAQYDSMQQTLQNALINAQKSADNIVQEAKAQAEAEIRQAREQSLRILEEAQSESSRISQSFEGVREQVRRYMATMRELLVNNQAMIDDYEARLASKEPREQSSAAAAPLAAGEPSAPAEHIPEFRTPTSFEQEAAGMAEPAPSPLGRELSPETGGETPRPGMEELPRPPIYSPEQEMEFVRESQAGEAAPIPPPPPAPEAAEPVVEPMPRPHRPEPAGKPEGEAGEKHFFWE